MVSFMMVMPALTGTSATYANSNVTNVTIANIDIGDAIELAIQLWDAISEAFCPDEPQNRCKNNKCGSGACISFRPACGTIGSVC